MKVTAHYYVPTEATGNWWARIAFRRSAERALRTTKAPQRVHLHSHGEPCTPDCYTLVLQHV